MIDIVHTLSQFTKLAGDVKNLPRIPLDAVVGDEVHFVGDPYLTVSDVNIQHPGQGSVTSGSDHSNAIEGWL